jgi:DNA modification methylase
MKIRLDPSQIPEHLLRYFQRKPKRCGACFVCHLVTVFRGVRRVLRDDGCAFVNMGDSFCTVPHGPKGANSHDPKNPVPRKRGPGGQVNRNQLDGYKHKDMVGIPWAFAFAMRADGWYLRQAIPWIKRNAMCESVNDRPGSAVEYVFQFTKRPKYYYDRYAVLLADSGKPSGNDFDRPHRLNQGDGSKEQWEPGYGRNRRNSDWWLESMGAVVANDGTFLGLDVPTKGIKDEHFACYPVELVEPLILAGTSEKGACVKCGAPWKRIVEKERKPTRPGVASKVYAEPPLADGSPYRQHHGDVCGNRDPQRHVTVSRTVGWGPTCGCGETATRPCVILDPFLGSGTTIIAALKHGRAGIGCELSEPHAVIARRRILNALATVKDDTLPATDKDRLALFGE